MTKRQRRQPSGTPITRGSDTGFILAIGFAWFAAAMILTIAIVSIAGS